MKTELNEQDKMRIKDAFHEAFPLSSGYGVTEFFAGAEYATIYEREQQAKPTVAGHECEHYLLTDVSVHECECGRLTVSYQGEIKEYLPVQQLEAERSELIEKMTELLKALNDSDKNYPDWVATKELYMAFTGVNNLLERLNSLKTK